MTEPKNDFICLECGAIIKDGNQGASRNNRIRQHFVDNHRLPGSKALDVEHPYAERIDYEHPEQMTSQAQTFLVRLRETLHQFGG